MKHMIVLFALLSCSLSSYALQGSLSEKTIFASTSELKEAVDTSINNTITNADSLSLIIDEVVISNGLTNEPRVIEIVCEFETYDGKKKVFSTVQRTLIEKGQEKTVIDTNYNQIISSQPLDNVKSISLSFNLRPIKNDKAELFRGLSELLVHALPDSNAISIVKSIIPPPEGDIDVPEMKAVFHVPNNFYHYETIKNANLKTPIFEPNKPTEIVFMKEESRLSSNILKNIFNAVLDTEYLKDKVNISGYVKITPTKLLQEQVNEKIRGNLTKAYNLIISEKDGKQELAESAIQEAETMMEVYYPQQNSMERINTWMYIRLLRLFAKYEIEKDYVIAPKYTKWVSYTDEFSTIQGVDKVFVKGIYSSERGALFFFPRMMDNYLVKGSLYMQKQLHRSIAFMDKKKSTNFIKVVSEDLSNSNLASIK